MNPAALAARRADLIAVRALHFKATPEHPMFHCRWCLRLNREIAALFYKLNPETRTARKEAA